MKLTIYKKMMLGFGAIILVMILVNGYTLLELEHVSETLHVTIGSDVRSIDLAKQLETILVEEDRMAEKFLITRDRAYYEQFVYHSRRFADSHDSLVGTLSDDIESAIAAEINDCHAWFVVLLQKKSELPARPRAVRLSEPVRTWVDSINALQEALDRLIQHNQVSVNDAMASVELRTAQSYNLALILAACTLGLAIIGAFVITQTITRPIRTLIRGTERIALGSFEPVYVTSRDEIAMLADAINDMSRNLKKIDELKAEMIERISHELRSPLATIQTAHHLLAGGRAGLVTTEQTRLLNTIKINVERLTRFSHEFLDLAKIQAGMMEYRQEPVDLVAVVRPLVEDARLVASQKKVTIELATEPIPVIVGDPERISQIASNLISNAVKYTLQGGTVRVELGPCKMGVRLNVIDSGIGIAKEDLPKVFNRFFRAVNAARAGSKGTGVGLSLVKALTEGHGGTVRVTSTLGEGSTFTVELPADTRPARGARAHERTKTGATEQS